MEGPLVPHAAAPRYSPAAPRPPSSYSTALLKRLKKATKRKSPPPRPPHVSAAVASTAIARQLVASAVATAHAVTNEKEPRKPVARIEPPPRTGYASESDAVADEEPPEISMDDLHVSSDELQLAEWRHHAQFEFAISARHVAMY